MNRENRNLKTLTIRQHICIEMMKAVVSNREMINEVERACADAGVDRPTIIAKLACKYTDALIKEMNNHKPKLKK